MTNWSNSDLIARMQRAEARVEELIGERDEARRVLTEAREEADRHIEEIGVLRSEADAAEAQLAGMREALEPFAKVASSYDPPEGDDDSPAWAHVFRIGDLRRAARALSTTPVEAERGPPREPDDADQIIESCERVARRIGAKLVIDPEKLAAFRAASSRAEAGGEQ